jgi:TolA-binding protein
VYSDPRVIDVVAREFVPVRVHVRDQADEFKRLGARFNAQWTPTILIVDADGTERHRIEGFIPADDFLSQLALGLAKSAFGRGDFPTAQRLFREVRERYPESDAAPEAQYWEGVSRYKETGDATALAETARRFDQRYSTSAWAKKASVWKS